MEHLTKLFKLLELTRSQPQYGYVLAGIKKNELSDLAQHHYLVTMVAWQIALGAIKEGVSLNLINVLELALVHDLGELFGGDISMPYARINPKARKLAKAFESENQKFLAKFFGKNNQAHFRNLVKEVMDTKTDEGFIVKVADILEAAHYRLYMDKASKHDLEFNVAAIKKKLEKLKNKQLHQYLLHLVDVWSRDFLAGRGTSNIIVDLG